MALGFTRLSQSCQSVSSLAGHHAGQKAWTFLGSIVSIRGSFPHVHTTSVLSSSMGNKSYIDFTKDIPRLLLKSKSCLPMPVSKFRKTESVGVL